MESLKRELSEEAGLVESDYVIVSTNKQPKTSTATTLPAPFSLIIYKYGETDHKHIDMPYLIQSKTTNLRPRAGESSQIGWFTLKEIKDLNKNKLLEDSTLDICEWIFKNIISL